MTSKLAKRFSLLLVVGSMLAPRVSSAATASALVSATVLGPAGEETANGAVTLSRIAVETAPVELPRPARRTSTLATFRVGGGVSATFAVVMPEKTLLHSQSSQLEVGGLRTSGAGTLGSNGSSVVSVAADVRVAAGQAPGRYEGSYPVTIAYN